MIRIRTLEYLLEGCLFAAIAVLFVCFFPYVSFFFYCKCKNNLFTYLIAHNNPINGFRPAVTHPSRRPCFLDLVFPTDARSSSSPTSTDPCIQYPSRRSILLHTNYMAEPAQHLNINTLHNVYVVEELIQLTIESNAEITANSHWTEDLSKYSQGCCISA